MRKNKFLMDNKVREDKTGETRGDKRLSLAPPGYYNNICYQVVISYCSYHTSPHNNNNHSAPSNPRRQHRLLLSRPGRGLPRCPPETAGPPAGPPAGPGNPSCPGPGCVMTRSSSESVLSSVRQQHSQLLSQPPAPA